MKKRLVVFLLIVGLAALIAVPVTVFARAQAISSTQFYACENPSDGTVDANSFTQDSSLDCSSHGVFSSLVSWSVTGPQGPAGQNGTNGTNGTDGAQGPAGPQGPKGDTGAPGIPFSHAACSETGLSGSAAQENAVFCQSGIEADGGLIYTAAINAAKAHVLVGTPIAALPSTDWMGLAVIYVEFSSGYHAEYHSDNVVRIYNSLNQRVF